MPKNTFRTSSTHVVATTETLVVCKPYIHKRTRYIQALRFILLMCYRLKFSHTKYSVEKEKQMEN